MQIAVSTGLGSPCCVPSACRSSPRATANRTKQVVIINRDGARLNTVIRTSSFSESPICCGDPNCFGSRSNGSPASQAAGRTSFGRASGTAVRPDSRDRSDVTVLRGGWAAAGAAVASKIPSAANTGIRRWAATAVRDARLLAADRVRGGVRVSSLGKQASVIRSTSAGSSISESVRIPSVPVPNTSTREPHLTR